MFWVLGGGCEEEVEGGGGEVGVWSCDGLGSGAEVLWGGEWERVGMVGDGGVRRSRGVGRMVDGCERGVEEKEEDDERVMGK